jgi:pimeloyl-ACP methyl ester carboxylesterase
MAPITNLYARYAYPDGGADLPIAVMMHGFGSGTANFLADDSISRIARYGLFVCSVGMRGRNGASGSQDASGREIYDIYDVLAKIRSDFAAVVSTTHAGIIGYSGGGGNALAAACKAPDAWTVVASHFGMSDYGRDGTDGWYFNGGNTATLDSWIGGSPATVPDAYFARDATYALGTNYSGGHLYLFHDEDDDSVPIVHSERAAASMVAASRTNYTESYTTAASSPRWEHGNPNIGDAGEPCIQTEPTWAAALAAKTHAVWTVPASGSVNVIGYIKTKRFSIWLGTGVSEVADVSYDTALDQYIVTPQTGSIDVVITQGAKTASQTISSQTTLTVV